MVLAALPEWGANPGVVQRRNADWQRQSRVWRRKRTFAAQGTL